MEAIKFGNDLPGFVCGPEKGPGLVVLQEWWGITPEIKEQAEYLSKSGFRCLVPDLYKGKLGVDAEEASHLMNNLDWPGAVEEMKAAVKYLKDSGCPKVGSVGFCMGGALATIAAQHCGVEAAAPFYGTPSPGICDPSKITVPVQGHFGEEDSMKGFSDPDAAKKLESNIKGGGNTDVEVFIYPGCGHAFMNKVGSELRGKVGGPPTTEEAQKQAWERVIAFFSAKLK